VVQAIKKPESIMALSSPFIAKSNTVQGIMYRVLAALMPAILVYAYAFGAAVLVNLILASISVLAAEALMLRLRHHPLQPSVLYGSALLTAWLLALSIPPMTPWWLIVVGSVFAIVVAKHLYGGLGNNLFNPAMAGFAVLMVSFPVFMTQWPAPLALAKHTLDFGGQLTYIFTGALPAGLTIDAINSATPLDTIKTQLKLDHALNEIFTQPLFQVISARGTLLVSLMYLVGGLYLVAARIITWHIPMAFLGGVILLATTMNLYDPSRYTDALFHLVSGATMLGAFFIATDYVTSPQSPVGKLIYGATAGMLTYVIRVWGGYPDGVAFAVLIMNCAVPLIDAYTPPPVFGHKKEAAR
jgi:electron transport complex protein RnfD